MSTIIAIADAVVALLGTGTFSQPITPLRSYQPTYELKDLDVLKVNVVPRAIAIEPGTRSASFREVTVDVAIQKKVTPEDTAAMDGLMDLVEEIVGFLNLKNLSSSPSWKFKEITNDPVFEPDHLKDWRQFTSIVSVRYAALK